MTGSNGAKKTIVPMDIKNEGKTALTRFKSSAALAMYPLADKWTKRDQILSVTYSIQFHIRFHKHKWKSKKSLRTTIFLYILVVIVFLPLSVQLLILG